MNSPCSRFSAPRQQCDGAPLPIRTGRSLRSAERMLHACGPDVAARVVMAELSRQTAQQVIVDNRPGASGLVGTEIIARATPDGYTIGHGNINTMAINRSVLPKLPYDVDRDLQAVGLMYNSPNLLAVTLSLPVKSVQELIDYAKRNPDKLIFASTGNGSSVHVGMGSSSS